MSEHPTWPSLTDEERDPNRLREARDSIFKGRAYFPIAEYKQLRLANYVGFDLEVWGRTREARDTRLFLASTFEAEDHLRRIGLSVQERKDAIVLGSGPCRLLAVYIKVLSLLRYRKVVFVDIAHSYLTRCLHLISSFRPDGPTILVQAVQADILSLPFIDRQFDVAYCLWHVTPELIDPSSPDHFRRYRDSVFHSLSKILKLGGLLIEEVPDVDTANSFYNIANLTTAQVLSEARSLPILGNLSGSALLSYFGALTAASPYHLRYTPRYTDRLTERKRSGFGEPIASFADCVNSRASSEPNREYLAELLSSKDPIAYAKHLWKAMASNDDLDEDKSVLRYHHTAIWPALE